MFASSALFVVPPTPSLYLFSMACNLERACVFKKIVSWHVTLSSSLFVCVCVWVCVCVLLIMIAQLVCPVHGSLVKPEEPGGLPPDGRVREFARTVYHDNLQYAKRYLGRYQVSIAAELMEFDSRTAELIWEPKRNVSIFENSSGMPSAALSESTGPRCLGVVAASRPPRPNGPLPFRAMRKMMTALRIRTFPNRATVMAPTSATSRFDPEWEDRRRRDSDVWPCFVGN